MIPKIVVSSYKDLTKPYVILFIVECWWERQIGIFSPSMVVTRIDIEPCFIEQMTVVRAEPSDNNNVSPTRRKAARKKNLNARRRAPGALRPHKKVIKKATKSST